MKASEMIEKLAQMINEHGDVVVTIHDRRAGWDVEVEGVIFHHDTYQAIDMDEKRDFNINLRY